MKKIFASLLLLLIAGPALPQAGTLNSGSVDTDLGRHLATKTLTREIPLAKGGHVFIQNNFQDFEVRTWDKDIVKTAVTVRYNSAQPLTDEALWKKSKMVFTTSTGTVKIQRMPDGANTIQSGNKTSTLTGSDLSPKLNHGRNIQREMIIYLPNTATLEVTSGYSDILVTGRLTTAEFKLENSQLEMGDADRLKLTTGYSNVVCGNIGTFDARFQQGRLIAGNVQSFTGDTQGAVVRLGDVKQAQLQSQSDDYEIGIAGTLTANKKMGTMRLESLTKTLDFQGENADLKVRSINPGTSSVTITNSFATIDLPLSELKNYTISFTGKSARVYAPFEISSSNASSVLPAEKGVTRFSHQAGTSGNTQTSIRINCTNCSVDLK